MTLVEWTHADNHVRAMHAVDQARRSSRRRVRIGTMNQIDVAGNQFDETVDILGGDLCKASVEEK
jgi:hypothetical protein